MKKYKFYVILKSIFVYRRKYMLTTTDKANELVPKFRQISKDWEHEIGLTEEDYYLKKRLKEIAIKGMDLTKEGV